MASPSPRQTQVLQIIARHMDERGYPPTLREIAAECGLSTARAPHNLVLALERHGCIHRTPHTARGMKITALGAAYLMQAFGLVATVPQTSRRAADACA